ncbi:MAG: hypothetical protein SNH27_17580 [Rikenellaceae bacterium]
MFRGDCKFLDWASREPVRTVVVVRWIHVSAVEVQVVPIRRRVGRSTPVVPVAATVVQSA